MALIGISGKIGVGKNLTASIIQYWLWKAKVKSAQNTSIHYTFTDFINNEALSDKLSGWETVRFADKLKDIVCILLGCTREQLEDREYKETELGEEWWYWKNSLGKTVPYLENPTYDRCLNKLTPRRILQLMGTECGRQIIHSNIWVNATMSDYHQKYDAGDIIDGKVVSIYPEDSNWIITDCRFLNEAKAVKDRDGIMIRVNRPHYGTSMVDLANAHESELALDTYEHFNYIIDNDGIIEDLAVKIKEILLKERML